jgi:hypothetical protein
MRILKRHIPLVLVLLVLSAPPNASACPGCKEGMADQPGSNGAGLRRGYFWSIVLMAGMPFGLATAGGLAIKRAVSRGLLPEM